MGSIHHVPAFAPHTPGPLGGSRLPCSRCSAWLPEAGWRLRFDIRFLPETRSPASLPLVVLHLEDGRWIDFVAPPPVMYVGLAANVLAVIAASLLPLLLASVIFERKQKDQPAVA